MTIKSMTIRHAITFTLLALPCIFSSALIFPELFMPLRVPLYLISIFASIPFLRIAPVKLKGIVAVLVYLLFLAAIFSGLWVEQHQFYVNIRQWILYSSIFWCGLIGVITFRMTSCISAIYAEKMLFLFLFLLAYGIYTYIAQLFDLPEFLSILRPNPDLSFDNLYSQKFYGWASSERAYSVWYEPSFSALVFACYLPLLYFPVSRRLKIAVFLLAFPYAYLTFSRSVWLVGGFFILGHFTGLFKLKLSQAGLVLVAMTLGVVLIVIQSISSGSHDEMSALIRILSIEEGMAEWLDNPLFGTGQAEIIKSSSGIYHIHASIPSMMHWYGLIGLLIVLIPYWYLAEGGSGFANKAKTSFIYLSIIAISVGGALLMISIFWFFWGFYMSSIQRKESI